MHILKKTKTIEAAHSLPNHDGKCRGLHGHSWEISILVSGQLLNMIGAKQGMLMDYYDIGQIMKKHVEVLDHRNLNDIWDNPTSEVIAESLFKKMEKEVEDLSKGKAKLVAVHVSETKNSVAVYGE